MEELEAAGLAERRSNDTKGLRKGHVLIYSWATPKSQGEEKKIVGEHAYNFPEWFPEDARLRSLFLRYKIALSDDFVGCAAYKEELEALAQDYKSFLDRFARVAERVCAPGTSPPASLYERNGKELKRKEPSSSAFSTVVESEPPVEEAEEEEAGSVKASPPEEEPPPTTYQTLKSLYPNDHFDEAKTKPTFEGLKPAEKRRCIERLQQYLSCERWQADGGRWIPLASNWIKAYDTDPPPALKKKAAGIGGTDEEIEEFYRCQRETVERVNERRGGRSAGLNLTGRPPSG
jgi:hypothetical protein